MKGLRILVDHLDLWAPYFPTDNLQTTQDYLTTKHHHSAYLINLSDDTSYLGQGYYASLLAEANGDKVIPSVSTLNNLQHLGDLSFSLLNIRLNSQAIDVLEELNQDNTVHIKLYFGTSAYPGFGKLARKIFDIYNAPLLQIGFIKTANIWQIHSLTTISLQSLNDAEETFFANALSDFSTKVWRKPRSQKQYRYEMAILVDPDEALPPSNNQAIKKFIKAGRALGVDVDLITKEDYARLPEYDGLFIRTNTQINHYSYAFAKKAEENNLVVMDSTQTIMRCTNKVYLHNLMEKNHITMPESYFVFRRNTPPNCDELIEKLGLPIVLKVPDGSFSKGVKKAKTKEDLISELNNLLSQSSIIIAQKYHYTDYDWRIGVLNNKPLYACKYYMAPNHWQIVNHGKKNVTAGPAEAFGIHQVPKDVIKIALKACRLIGHDLYGVDIKMIDDKPAIIEINDNPSIDHPWEDAYLSDELYSRIMLEFVNRMEHKRVHYDD
ncbi:MULTISPECIES: RimK family protein [Cysteiniphilum]|uniref:30S ribosomal protein S6 n=1 Tax=Cysteiniphilum litorale TaxID=2056700 RepID=A0A8J3E8S9_9GAMM|nr:MULTISPECIES: RimK family protein [Cysteiniphilum]GGG01273.1 30S ribosomal protein S6 [Cysteiniphilum litorale]